MAASAPIEASTGQICFKMAQERLGYPVTPSPSYDFPGWALSLGGPPGMWTFYITTGPKKWKSLPERPNIFLVLPLSSHKSSLPQEREAGALELISEILR